MKLVFPKGATSRIVTVFIQDSSSTTGAGLGSLTNASSIVGGYVREGGTGVALAVDEDVTTEGTYQAPSGAGKVRIGTPVNMRTGTYELHFHNNLWATGAETVTITLGGASNMAPLNIEVQLSDPVRGLGAPTALPNAAADAAGGLPISDAGGLDLDAMNAKFGTVSNLGSGATIGDNLSDIHNHTTDIVNATTIYSSSASSGTTTTLVDASLTQTDDYWNGCWIKFISGNNIGQVRLITDFVAGTDTITFAPAVANAVTTHSYVIIPAAITTADVVMAAGTTVQAASGRFQVDAELIEGGAAGDAIENAVTVSLEAMRLQYLVALEVTDPNDIAENSVMAKLVSTIGDYATYDEATMSLQAIRARGDAAWATATGFSTHSAADVWAAASRTLTAGTNIQLPSNGLANVTAWTVAITGNITGNLSGSVASVAGAVGSVTAGVNLADGAITDAKFTIPTLTSPATGVVGMIVQTWRRWFKKTHYDIAGNTIKTYADNGSTVVTTQTTSVSATDEDVGAAT